MAPFHAHADVMTKKAVKDNRLHNNWFPIESLVHLVNSNSEDKIISEDVPVLDIMLGLHQILAHVNLGDAYDLTIVARRRVNISFFYYQRNYLSA
jgi:hypothetical protein